jgi:hypothetical protein
LTDPKGVDTPAAVNDEVTQRRGLVGCSALALPAPPDVDRLSAAELLRFVAQCSALQMHALMRLQAAAGDRVDDCDAFEVEEAARRLTVSVDLLRERGVEWGVALVLTRDKQGRATRVTYPRARLRAFLEGRPATTKSAA